MLASAFSNFVGPTQSPWVGGQAGSSCHGDTFGEFLRGLLDPVQAAWCRAEPPRPSDGGQLRAPATGPPGGLGANTAAKSIPED